MGIDYFLNDANDEIPNTPGWGWNGYSIPKPVVPQTPSVNYRRTPEITEQRPSLRIPLERPMPYEQTPNNPNTREETGRGIADITHDGIIPDNTEGLWEII